MNASASHFIYLYTNNILIYKCILEVILRNIVHNSSNGWISFRLVAVECNLLMSPNIAKNRRYRAPALDKGLDILEVLANSQLPLSQVELAQKLGRSQGEFFRMLTCLEERGYVIRESESGRFKLTLRLYELGHKQNATSMLRNAARVPMEKLAEQVGLACHLSVQFGSSLLTLMERMPTRRICLTIGEGTTFPKVETSSGKLLLSQITHGEVEALLAADESFQAKTLRERKKTLDTIYRTREMNYIITASILTKGVTDVAVTIGLRGTDTFGVLAISYLTATSQKKRIDQGHLEAVQHSASEINRNLGIIL